IVGDEKEALKAFNDLIKIKPDASDYATYSKIALIHAEQGSFEEATEALAEYTRRASPEGQVLAPMYQARLAEAMGDYRAAEAGYLRAAAAQSALGRTEAAGE